MHFEAQSVVKSKGIKSMKELCMFTSWTALDNINSPLRD